MRARSPAEASLQKHAFKGIHFEAHATMASAFHIARSLSVVLIALWLPLASIAEPAAAAVANSFVGSAKIGCHGNGNAKTAGCGCSVRAGIRARACCCQHDEAHAIASLGRAIPGNYRASRLAPLLEKASARLVIFFESRVPCPEIPPPVRRV